MNKGFKDKLDFFNRSSTKKNDIKNIGNTLNKPKTNINTKNLNGQNNVEIGKSKLEQNNNKRELEKKAKQIPNNEIKNK